MYAQLGQIVFQGLFGFDSFESTNNPTYAQHDLINAKPVLQPTGYELEELSITIKLRADFVNVSEALAQLQQSRDKYEVLALIKGNGVYVGDFIIAEFGKTENVTFADGTVLEATVTLLLKEYASSDKLQQQQTTARKNAFASGDKKVVNIAQRQLPTTSQLTAQDLAFTGSYSNVVNNQVTSYQNNPGAQVSIADQIQKSLKKMEGKIGDVQQKVQDLTNLSNLSDLMGAIGNVKTCVLNFTFPIASVQDLLDNNQMLQSAMQALRIASAELNNLIITRAA